MNVYDFDKTIYDGDSTLNFYFYCLKLHPYILVCLPIQFWAAIKYKLGFSSKTVFKEHFYFFLKLLRDTNHILDTFWEKEQYKIKEFYISQKKDTDVIISASPYFLLYPICRKLNIKNLLASNVDISSGKYEGLNCYGEEKVIQFKKYFSLSEINNFYSDSPSDLPMAKYAKNAFLVKKDNIIKWNIKES